MRGNNRSKKKQFNPTKFILFGVSLILLCNVMPWKYFERRLKKGWTDITSFDDAMDFAKAYSGKAKVRSYKISLSPPYEGIRGRVEMLNPIFR